MRRREWWQLGGLVTCAVMVPLLVGGPGAYLLALLVVPAFLIGRRGIGLRPALIAFGLGVLVQVLAAVMVEPRSLFSEAVLYLLHDLVVLFVPWWIGRVLQLRALRRSKEEAIIADLARAHERARIAEDMHDLLGHDLALIALHSGALELLPEATAEQRRAAAQIRERAVAATDRLREILGVLRSGEALGDEGVEPRRSPEGLGLDRIIARARESGMDITVTSTGTSPDGRGPAEVTAASTRPEPQSNGPAEAVGPAEGTVPAEGNVPDKVTVPAEGTMRAVERVVQEALTNAAKHAPGAAVEVALETTDEDTRVTVTNGPAGTPERARLPPSADERAQPPTSAGGRIESPPSAREETAHLTHPGMGLIAAQERVRYLGGTLTAGPHQGGFQVTARIPATPRPGVPTERAGPEAEHRLGDLRRSTRTSLRRAAFVPAICTVLVLGAFAVFHILTFTSVALPSQDFAQIAAGEDQSDATALLPPSHITADRLPESIAVPAAPEGSECRFYLARDSVLDFSGDVYRICIGDGVVTAADRLTAGGS